MRGAQAPFLFLVACEVLVVSTINQFSSERDKVQDAQRTAKKALQIVYGEEASTAQLSILSFATKK
jgi:hypothetical protein